MITNGVDAELYVPRQPDATILERYGLDGKFVCSYVGTIGMAHGLDVVIRAAQRLKQSGRSDVAFLLVGDGAKRADLAQQAQDAGVADRVVFTGRLTKQEMPTVLASSDCCLVHLHGTELFGTVIPSKIFETMAMERPIIMGVKGPRARLCWPHKLVFRWSQIRMRNWQRLSYGWRTIGRRRAAMGRRGRSYVLQHYHRDRLAAEYLDLLTSVAIEPRTSTLLDGAQP